MSSILFNPFKSAADQAEQKLAQYVDSSSLGRLLRGTKSELTKRWAGTALLLNDGKVEVVPAEGEFVRILENGKVEVKSWGGGSIRGRGTWRDEAWLEVNVKALWLSSLHIKEHAADASRDGRGDGSGAGGNGRGGAARRGAARQPRSGARQLGREPAPGQPGGAGEGRGGAAPSRRGSSRASAWRWGRAPSEAGAKHGGRGSASAAA